MEPINQLPYVESKFRNQTVECGELGIPTVVDRFIQQAIQQVLTPIFEPLFSQHSYGFRPGKSARQAVLKAQGYIQHGKKIVVDIDLEKFFDRVNHDLLMTKVAKHVSDTRDT